MNLHDLKPADNANKNRKRRGRGGSSGLGTTSGRGHKGQKARSGGGVRPGFEGGQMPLTRRLPKRGFDNSKFAKTVEIVNLSDIERKYSEGETVNRETLVERGLIKGNKDLIKVLGEGDISKKLTFDIDKVSGSAEEKIKKAGSELI
ncbi:MAG: 50S ribosomal protein L15 [Flexistipes sinusarabici]|uniref:Large ribosomal subunit protein uL15 n=1 Tax=Flexistipes sinusarabici TaxID=2352 RepID=A0A5D0MHZ4_FLESI|nr:50S ribosomal protein L15 [Flexistipes sinusarabici]TYB33297.1 MAG: 50S ribosomal protein L15 [Flexistipes sinusarabici]